MGRVDLRVGMTFSEMCAEICLAELTKVGFDSFTLLVAYQNLVLCSSVSDNREYLSMFLVYKNEFQNHHR